MAIKAYRYLDYFTQRQNKINEFFIVFYIIGVTGMLVPFTFLLFLKLIPIALLLNFIILAIYYAGEMNLKTMVCFFLIYILAFTIEAIGVNSGKIFGHYKYGYSLGPKLFETPLIIGINWLFLVYTTASVTDKLKIPVILRILLASMGMLVYDLVLEQVAPKLDMWHWKNENVPDRNYIVWFSLALFFHSIFKIFKIKSQNNLALLILTCQLLFFLVLYIFI